MRGAVLIAGGGIGGLAAALALAQSGFEVRVFEARASPEEAGAGIQVSANGMKALRALGLEDAALSAASRPEQVQLRLPGSGRIVARVPLGAAHAKRYGAAYGQLHRADLHRLLLDAAEAHGGISLELGAEITRATQTQEGVGIDLAGGGEAEGSVLIGADGIHSTVREYVCGADRPRFTGMMAWRAVVPAEGRAAPALTTVWMGRGRHLVQYPIRGGAEVNLVGVVERADWTGESWSERGDPAAMRADFAGWHASTDALLGRVTEAWRWALHERRTPSTWSAGRIAVLGDACHAMPPFLAQGACLALEDAVVLARRLRAEAHDPAHALRQYSDMRRKRAARAQAASWANAWRFHLKHGMARFAVYGALGTFDRLMPGRAARMFDWLYGYDAGAA